MNSVRPRGFGGSRAQASEDFRGVGHGHPSSRRGRRSFISVAAPVKNPKLPAVIPGVEPPEPYRRKDAISKGAMVIDFNTMGGNPRRVIGPQSPPKDGKKWWALMPTPRPLARQPLRRGKYDGGPWKSSSGWARRNRPPRPRPIHDSSGTGSAATPKVKGR